MAQMSKEWCREYMRRWRAANKEHLREYTAGRAAKRRVTTARWDKANAERRRAVHQVWYQATRERRLEASRLWKLNNPEKARAKDIEWRKNNPEKARAKDHRKRALKKRATIADCTAAIANLKKITLCHWCDALLTKTTHTIDHVVPLARGGTHAPDNLVVACRSCNSSRGAKLVSEWKGRPDARVH
jgi:5-methylcytosine-specific restriction endonuclease McrA